MKETQLYKIKNKLIRLLKIYNMIIETIILQYV